MAILLATGMLKFDEAINQKENALSMPIVGRVDYLERVIDAAKETEATIVVLSEAIPASTIETNKHKKLMTTIYVLKSSLNTRIIFIGTHDEAKDSFYEKLVSLGVLDIIVSSSVTPDDVVMKINKPSTINDVKRWYAKAANINALNLLEIDEESDGKVNVVIPEQDDPNTKQDQPLQLQKHTSKESSTKRKFNLDEIVKGGRSVFQTVAKKAGESLQDLQERKRIESDKRAAKQQALEEEVLREQLAEKEQMLQEEEQRRIEEEKRRVEAENQSLKLQLEMQKQKQKQGPLFIMQDAVVNLEEHDDPQIVTSPKKGVRGIEALQSVPHRTVIYSPKGGAGATTLALALVQSNKNHSGYVEVSYPYSQATGKLKLLPHRNIHDVKDAYEHEAVVQGQYVVSPALFPATQTFDPAVVTKWFEKGSRAFPGRMVIADLVSNSSPPILIAALKWCTRMIIVVEDTEESLGMAMMQLDYVRRSQNDLDDKAGFVVRTTSKKKFPFEEVLELEMIGKLPDFADRNWKNQAVPMIMNWMNSK